MNSSSFFSHQTIQTLVNYWPKSISSELLSSLVLLLVSVVALKVYARFVRSSTQLSIEQRRHQIVSMRNRVGFLFLAISFLIWAGEIRSLLISIAAIAAALLIVSKEMFANFLGSLLFSFSKPARIGDIVEIGSFKGELLDVSWFHISLMEVSPSKRLSGKILMVPNNFLLTTPLIKTHSLGNFKPTFLSIPIHVKHASAAQQKLEHIAQTHTDLFAQQAQDTVDEIQRTHLIDTPDAKAICSIVPKEKEYVELHLRYVHPNDERARTEQKIIQDFYSWYQTTYFPDGDARSATPTNNITSTNL